MKRDTFQFRNHLILEPIVCAMAMLVIPAYLPASGATLTQDPNATLPSAKKPAPTTESVPPAKKSLPAPKKSKPPARMIRTSSRPSSTLLRTLTNQAGIEFVLIPGGSFMMGSSNGQPDEKPVHRVTISYSFYMGKDEVTQAQWESVMGNSPSTFQGAPGNEIAKLNNANKPVETVSWLDAQQFIERLNATNDGFLYRLPTEAEWEYACRAGTTGDYAGVLDSMAWYGNNSGNSYVDVDSIYDNGNYAKFLSDNSNGTHTVGTKQANAFGLYDMHGNVWEWCEDWYHPSYVGAPSDGSAWLSGGEQKYRVVRGGSWSVKAYGLRSAYRLWWTPGLSSYIFGFRVVAVVRTSNPNFRIK